MLHLDALNVLRDEPPIAETPSHVLVERVTPSASVYVRSNFPTPMLGQGHRVRVGGAVLRPFEFGLDELQAMESRTIVMTMECAGNDRLGMLPVPDGEPWNHGAISTVEWTGVSLGALLDRAGVTAEAVEIVAVGADKGARDGHEHEVSFARSLPLYAAVHDDTLVAFAMNGQPLEAVHGAPFRLVVPRWYGMASVKWLQSLQAVIEPFTGHFQRERYVYDTHDGVDPVTTMRVKSFITSPAHNASINAGRVNVMGWAWSGDGKITGVEVRVGSAAWQKAHVESATNNYAWVRWSADIVIENSGQVEISSRATDSTGAVQPVQILWNRLGYGNNAIRSITVHLA